VSGIIRFELPDVVAAGRMFSQERSPCSDRRRGSGQNMVSLIRDGRAGHGPLLLQGAAENEAAAEPASHRKVQGYDGE
jgi:hypothetical protein